MLPNLQGKQDRPELECEEAQNTLDSHISYNLIYYVGGYKLLLKRYNLVLKKMQRILQNYVSW